MRIVPSIILLLVLLSGCAIGGLVSSRYDTTDAAITARVSECSLVDMTPSKCKDSPEIKGASLVVMCPSSEIGILTSCKPKEAHALTIENFVAIWGEPKARGKKYGLDYLTYDKNIA